MSRLAKLQEFLAIDENDSFTRYAIGLEYAKEKRYREAIEALEELRTRDPKYVPTYYMLASYYRESGQNDSAFNIYKDGMKRAREANDLHALSELQAAFDELEDEL